MHFYNFNIGDYRRRTNHLTPLEHGVYRMLLDTYYLEEKPLTLELNRLMRSHSIRSAEEKDALTNVLMDFFIETPEGYINKACDEVIAKYEQKVAKAKASADARWHPKNNKPCERIAKELLSKDPKTQISKEPKEKGVKKKSSRFTPPSLDDIKKYAKEKNLQDYSIDFFEFYESKAWYIGKNKMKKWEMAYSRWCRKQKDFAPTAQADSRVNTNQPKSFEELEKAKQEEWKRRGFKSDQAMKNADHKLAMENLAKLGGKRV